MNKQFFDIQIKSSERVKNLGEVFTPEKYIHQMLDLLDKSIWPDINKIFFEPTCGHGNFVLAVLQRRLDAFYKKAFRDKIKNPTTYAITASLNTIYAIDIKVDNIFECRQRVLNQILDFYLTTQRKIFYVTNLSAKDQEFLAHVLCCLVWHINQNEAISSLYQDKKKVTENSFKTKIENEWVNQKKTKLINFEKPWVNHFAETNNSTNLLFEKSKKVTTAILNKKNIDFRKFKEFAFAKNSLMNHSFGLDIDFKKKKIFS